MRTKLRYGFAWRHLGLACPEKTVIPQYSPNNSCIEVPNA